MHHLMGFEALKALTIIQIYSDLQEILPFISIILLVKYTKLYILTNISVSYYCNVHLNKH